MAAFTATCAGSKRRISPTLTSEMPAARSARTTERGILRRECQRLLDQHRLARLDAGQREVDVERIWCCDDHRIDEFDECLGGEHSAPTSRASAPARSSSGSEIAATTAPVTERCSVPTWPEPMIPTPMTPMRRSLARGTAAHRSRGSSHGTGGGVAHDQADREDGRPRRTALLGRADEQVDTAPSHLFGLLRDGGQTWVGDRREPGCRRNRRCRCRPVTADRPGEALSIRWSVVSSS